jgi:hypothetical protein
MANLFVAVDVGCIECGEETAVLGVFTPQEKAEKVCDDHRQRQALDWYGEHRFGVFPIDEVDVEHRVEYSWRITS